MLLSSSRHPVLAAAGDVVALTTLLEILGASSTDTQVDDFAFLKVPSAQRRDAVVSDLSNDDGGALLEGTRSRAGGGSQEAKGDGDLHCD